MANKLTFWECLFDPNDVTCITNSPKGTAIACSYALGRESAFFSINPLHLNKDTNPVEEWHRADVGRRADCNVTAFRNILIEMDKISIEEQETKIKEISLPYSTAVYSGGKSIHYIISLATPLSSHKEYTQLVERVYRAVGKTLVDRANKNPSRLSRLPGHLRADTEKVQELLEVRGRVENAVLDSWLDEHGAPTIPEEDKWENLLQPMGLPRDFSSLSGATKTFLMCGAQDGWNLSLFKAAADMARNGFTQDEAYEEFLKITGTLDKFDDKTIRSAYRNEENQK